MSKAQERLFFFTIDADWVPGSYRGLEELLRFCEKYHIPATVFVAGRFAATYPSLIAETASVGHLVGCHGWEHVLNWSENYRTAPYEVQRERIIRATEAIESAIGVRPICFRAPFLWVSGTMLNVLEELGYEIDSSVPSRRFDAGFGMVNGFGHFLAPLNPYHPSRTNLSHKGESPIVEVPPSAFLVPMNMTSLRLFGPWFSLWLAKVLLFQTKILNFYCHPFEFTVADEQEFPPQFPLRHREGIGPQQLDKLGAFVVEVLSRGYRPATLQEACALV